MRSKCIYNKETRQLEISVLMRGKGLQKAQKAIQKLERKRDLISAFLLGQKIPLDDPLDFVEVCKKASKHFRLAVRYNYSTASLHAAYSNILNLMLSSGVVKSPSDPSEDQYKRFYQSLLWRNLRYSILKRDGALCRCCGRGAKDGIIVHVDHIKPLRHHWDLRLVPTNLQILCEDCNRGKGSTDETDWR